MPRSLYTNGSNRGPWGLRWRASIWFVTAVVSAGITTDLIVYSSIIPVIPFQLERLHYSDVSTLTGWLLFAYSVGLVGSTIPIAIYSERWVSRRTPLLTGLLALIGSQILLMLAPNFAVMATARVLQGISSSMVWVVGLALLCDTTPEHLVGRQLGIAMTGLSVGLLSGSPIGGALYSRFGFHAPFIFGILCAALDLIARLFVIERHEAVEWDFDPWNTVAPSNASTVTLEAASPPPTEVMSKLASVVDPKEAKRQSKEPHPTVAESPRRFSIFGRTLGPESTLVRKPSSITTVFANLMKSPRALTALAMSFINGVANSLLEPTLPLHLQARWGLNSSQVGLVYLGSFIPVLVSSPISGWLCDRVGSDYVTCVCLLLALPWWIALAMRTSLAVFITSLAIQSFFVGGVIPTITAELAAVSRTLPGVGFAHVYGAFNLVFGIGTAVGPIVGGQIYDHVQHGWTVLCCITAAVIMICLVLAFCYTGPEPLLSKLYGHMQRGTGSQESAAMPEAKEAKLAEPVKTLDA